MKWFFKWRLRRAEAALEIARRYLAACQDANALHDGAYLGLEIDAEAAERELDAVVKGLRRKLGLESGGL